jgi:hypothetical protein
VPTTSEFRLALRDQIATTQTALLAAQGAGEPRQVYRYSARLLDLLERAASNEIDTTGWITDDALSLASASCPTSA